MRLVIALIILLSSTACYASHTRPMAYPLEWWLREQNKFTGAVVRTKMEGDEYELGYWDVPGVARPNHAEIEIIMDDYEQYLADLAQEKIDSKDKTKQKLGMTDKQLEELKQALEITP